MNRYILYLILAGVVAGQLVQLPIGRFDIPILDVAVAAAVVAGIYQLISSGRWRELIYSKIFQVFAILVGVLLLSLLVNTSHYSLVEIIISSLFWVRLVTYGLLAFVFWKLPFNLDSTISWLWAFVTVAVVGFLMMGAFPDFEVFEYLGWDPHQFRLLSTFLDPNLVGVFLSFGAGLGLIAYSRKTRDRLGGGLATLIILAAIVLTFSRSALLAAVIVLGIIGWVLQRKLFFVGLLALILLVLFSPRLQERLSGIWQVDITVEHRLESWDEGLRIFGDHPLLGVGYNTLQFSRAEYIGDVDRLEHHSATGFDSSLLTIAATSGVVGLIAWLGFVGLAMALVWRRAFGSASNKNFSLLFVAITVGLLTASLFVNAWLYPPILAAWFVMLGLGLKENYGLDSS